MTYSEIHRGHHTCPAVASSPHTCWWPWLRLQTPGTCREDGSLQAMSFPWLMFLKHYCYEAFKPQSAAGGRAGLTGGRRAAVCRRSSAGAAAAAGPTAAHRPPTACSCSLESGLEGGEALQWESASRAALTLSSSHHWQSGCSREELGGYLYCLHIFSPSPPDIYTHSTSLCSHFILYSSSKGKRIHSSTSARGDKNRTSGWTRRQYVSNNSILFYIKHLRPLEGEWRDRWEGGCTC